MLSLHFKNFNILEHHNMASHNKTFPAFTQNLACSFLWLRFGHHDLRSTLGMQTYRGGCMTFGERVDRERHSRLVWFLHLIPESLMVQGNKQQETELNAPSDKSLNFYPSFSSLSYFSTSSRFILLLHNLFIPHWPWWILIHTKKMIYPNCCVQINTQSKWGC